MDEKYEVYNICIERLLDPLEAPPGIDAWHGVPLANLRAMLPFKAEHLNQINDESDVVLFSDAFAYALGTHHATSFTEFTGESRLFQIVSAECGEHEQSMRSVAVRALKYPYAIHNTLRGVVGEDMIFSALLPYLCETESDIRCSLRAIENGFYKQSLQMLRSALEGTVAHAYFGVRGQDYYDLALSAKFRMPRFAGRRDGMVDDLVAKGIIDPATKTEMIAIYQDLSGAVHSEIRRLTVTSGAPDLARIEEWASYVSHVGDLVLKSILRMLEKGI